MKRKRAWSPLELQPKVAEAVRSYMESSRLRRLARASDHVLAGKLVDAPDRELVAGILDAAYLHEFARIKGPGARAHRVAVADHVARKLRIPRHVAALFMVKKETEIDALVRAIARLRRRTFRAKRRK